MQIDNRHLVRKLAWIVCGAIRKIAQRRRHTRLTGIHGSVRSISAVQELPQEWISRGTEIGAKTESCEKHQITCMVTSCDTFEFRHSSQAYPEVPALRGWRKRVGSGLLGAWGRPICRDRRDVKIITDQMHRQTLSRCPGAPTTYLNKNRPSNLTWLCSRSRRTVIVSR